MLRQARLDVCGTLHYVMNAGGLKSAGSSMTTNAPLFFLCMLMQKTLDEARINFREFENSPSRLLIGA